MRIRSNSGRIRNSHRSSRGSQRPGRLCCSGRRDSGRWPAQCRRLRPTWRGGGPALPACDGLPSGFSTVSSHSSLLAGHSSTRRRRDRGCLGDNQEAVGVPSRLGTPGDPGTAGAGRNALMYFPWGPALQQSCPAEVVGRRLTWSRRPNAFVPSHWGEDPPLATRALAAKNQ